MFRDLKYFVPLGGVVTSLATIMTSISGQSFGEQVNYGCESNSWSYCEPCAPCEIEEEACSAHNFGFYFGTEGLWWTVNQDNLDYAVEFNSSDDDYILGPGDTKFLDFDWKVGGRGYLGFSLYGWDITGCYTWYKNHAHGHTDCTLSATELKPSFLHPSTDERDAERATGHNRIKYQTAEILFGRDLTFCENAFVLHPFFGAEAIQIKQNLKAEYEGGDFEHEVGRMKWHSDLEAIGLKAGFDMFYHWFCGLGVYGNFAGSVLASKTNIHHRQRVFDFDTDTSSSLIHLKEKEHVVVPGYQIGAGLSWDASCGKCFHFLLKAGYEFNQWFNTPQLRRYHTGNRGVSSDSKGNICFHGATLSLNFYF